jgi:hypothetical protein
VIGNPHPNSGEKSQEIGPLFHIKHVAFTAAIGCAKARHRALQPHARMQRIGPLVLAAPLVVGKPDTAQPRRSPQIVDVPARTLADPAVVVATRGDSTGTEGAADIEVPAPRQRHASETADFEVEPPGALQKQQIGAGAAVGLPPFQWPGPLSAMWER